MAIKNLHLPGRPSGFYFVVWDAETDEEYIRGKWLRANFTDDELLQMLRRHCPAGRQMYVQSFDARTGIALDQPGEYGTVIELPSTNRETRRRHHRGHSR